MSQNTPMPPVPAYALQVIDALEAAGFEAWVVGGWVRDALLGRPGHDVDVTTSAPWQQTAAVLRAAGIEVHETGTAHGTVTAVVAGQPVETTTYRVEGAYSDRRHPDDVRFVDEVREDLARRDFTVNAMAYHPRRGLLDPYGGEKDLAAGVIRAVGEPRLRFEEDALRVLRAVRFACRLGFDIEPATQEALVACAGELNGIANERVGQELQGILDSGRVAWAIRHQTDVFLAALPELAPARGFDQKSPYHAYDVLEHTARVCAGVEEFCGGVVPSHLRWAALLHDVAKPACASFDELGRGHFFGHQGEGARMAVRIMSRLALPKETVRRTAALIGLHDYSLQRRRPVSTRRMVLELERSCPDEGRMLAFDLLNLKRADAIGKAVAYRGDAVKLDIIERRLREDIAAGFAANVGELAIDGADVMRERGIDPGPGVGMVLREALECVVDGSVKNSREDLLSWLRY